jgi:hypothetical protein
MGQDCCPKQEGQSLFYGDRKDTKIHQVAIQILSYLRKNPDAKDTAAGIAQWWVHEDVRVVEKALHLLVAEGVIDKKKSIYQLRQNL